MEDKNRPTKQDYKPTKPLTIQAMTPKTMLVNIMWMQKGLLDVRNQTFEVSNINYIQLALYFVCFSINILQSTFYASSESIGLLNFES